MNAAYRRRLRPIYLLSLSAVMLFSVGCGKKAPDEANAALDAALKALPKGDAKTFVAGVLPAQQQKVPTLAEWAFFQAAKSHKIDNEYDLEVTEESALILTKLYFDDAQEVFSTLYFAMKKADGKWYIDLDETIKKERDSDGAHAFQAWKFQKKPG